MAAAEADAQRTLSGLLNAIAQLDFYKPKEEEEEEEEEEEVMRSQLFPELPREHFHALFLKMRGLLKSIASADMDHAQLEAFLTAQGRKQGGVDAAQAAALSRFWTSQRVRVRESLRAQSRWDPALGGLSWRVDLGAAGRQDSAPGGPFALVELEVGGAARDSEFVCLELDETGVNRILGKMADIQDAIDRVLQHA